MSKDTVATLAKRIKTLEARLEMLTDSFTELALRIDLLERLIVLLAFNNGFFTVGKNVKMVGLSPDKKIHEFLTYLPMVSEILGIKRK